MERKQDEKARVCYPILLSMKEGSKLDAETVLLRKRRAESFDEAYTKEVQACTRHYRELMAIALSVGVGGGMLSVLPFSVGQQGLARGLLAVTALGVGYCITQAFWYRALSRNALYLHRHASKVVSEKERKVARQRSAEKIYASTQRKKGRHWEDEW